MTGSHVTPVPAFQALGTARNRRGSRWWQDGVKSAVCASSAVCVEQNKNVKVSYHPSRIGGISFPLPPQNITHGLKELLRVGHSFFSLLLPSFTFETSNIAPF